MLSLPNTQDESMLDSNASPNMGMAVSLLHTQIEFHRDVFLGVFKICYQLVNSPIPDPPLGYCEYLTQKLLGVISMKFMSQMGHSYL